MRTYPSSFFVRLSKMYCTPTENKKPRRMRGLTNQQRAGIIIGKGTASKRLRPDQISLQRTYLKNRHLPEWRFLLFLMTKRIDQSRNFITIVISIKHHLLSEGVPEREPPATKRCPAPNLSADYSITRFDIPCNKKIRFQPASDEAGFFFFFF